jgi:hypothetical protein
MRDQTEQSDPSKQSKRTFVKAPRNGSPTTPRGLTFILSILDRLEILLRITGSLFSKRK